MEKKGPVEWVEDWDMIKKRYEAWWEGEIVDRIIMQVTAPKKGRISEESWENVDYEKYYTDVEFVIERNEKKFLETYYGAEAVPFLLVFLGPVIITAFVGCPLIFDKGETSWQKPIIDKWEDAPELRYNPENRWWKIIKQITEAAAEKGRGRYLVGITDMGGPGDDIANLRGPENACMDFILHPDKVEEVLTVMNNLWFQYYDELYSIISRKIEGSCGTYGIWSPGKTYTLQSDFSCMVSPEMFEKFIAPRIQKQASHLDHALYHLDGPDAIRHLDIICEIPEIHAINWTPGAGNLPMTKWIPLLKKIQEKGKSIHIKVQPNDIEPILKEISPRGVLFTVRCKDEDEAKEVIKKAYTWTSKYNK